MIIKSTELVNQLKEELKDKVSSMRSKPKLAIITDGHDRASEGYMKRKHKFGEEIGVEVETLNPFENLKAMSYPLSTTFPAWVDSIMAEKYSGAIVQLPIKEEIGNPFVAINKIPVYKDADKFTTAAIGELAQGDLSQLSATPKGIIKLIEYLGYNIEGKDIVIINRTNVIGKPLALALIQMGATVTVCHSKTIDLKAKMRKADIIISAIGIPNKFNIGDVSSNQLIIDAGTTFVNGKQFGDFNTEEIENHYGDNIKITSPTGCIGPLTVACLFENLIDDMLK